MCARSRPTVGRRGATTGRRASPALIAGVVSACVLLLATAGCGRRIHARPLVPPQQITPYCGGPDRYVRVTSILSILSSTSDQFPSSGASGSGAAPTTPTVRDLVRRDGGVIARWNDLSLLLPNLARRLGEPDEYVHVKAAAITTPSPTAETRPIELLIRVGRGRKDQYRWETFTAYDVQDVCVEAHRSGHAL